MIKVTCSVCGKVINFKDEHGGKSGRCPQCNELIKIPSAPTTPSEPSLARPSTPIHPPVKLEVPKIPAKFGALRTIGVFFRAIGVVLFIIAMIVALVMEGNFIFPVRIFLGILAGTILLLPYYALGDLIHVVLAIEENTRYNNELSLRREYGAKGES